MGIFAKIFIGMLAIGSLGGVWASFSGLGASSMRGTAHYQPSVRSGPVGHSRGYYHGGKY